jgi:hypothetical protein
MVGKTASMDTTTKRRLAERVRRRLTRRLQARGFARGKSTFWVRPKGGVVEFVHLHLFTFAPAFRVHSGTRKLNDRFEELALNGPDSDSSRSDAQRTYRLDFTEDELSLEQCADAIDSWCGDVAEPWFDRQCSDVEAWSGGEADPEAVRLSKQLLGVP